MFYQKPLAAFQELVVLVCLSSIKPLHLYKFQEEARSFLILASLTIYKSGIFALSVFHEMLEDIAVVAEGLWSMLSTADVVNTPFHIIHVGGKTTPSSRDRFATALVELKFLELCRLK